MKNCSIVAIPKQSYFANFRICNEVVKAIILQSECAQDFSLGSKLDEICHLSEEVWFSDDELLKEPAFLMIGNYP